MSNSSYVENILHSPITLLDEVLEQSVARTIYTATIEAQRQQIQADRNLLDSTDTVLGYLEIEEGFLSCFLYAKFGYEFQKNKRREQLRYFGSKIKLQLSEIKSRLYALNRQTERISYSIVDLEQLLEQFSSKDVTSENNEIQNKSKLCIYKIEEKIGQLDNLRLTLMMQHEALSEIEQEYSSLFKRIPRHKKLEENTLLLIGHISKK